MLKVMGTLESDYALHQWPAALQGKGKGKGWRVTATGAALELSKGRTHLVLEGDGLLLLHGEIAHLESDVTEIKLLLLGSARSLQFDVFEEDGRMVNRVYQP